MIFDDYVKKIKMSKNSKSGSNSILSHSKDYFYNHFSLSPSFYKVLINGEEVDSIVNRTSNHAIKQIFFRYEFQPEVGSVIKYRDKPHLLMEVDRDSMVVFGKMEECNNTFKISTGEKRRVLIGHDHLGRPHYDYEVEEVAVPCIVRDKYYSSNENTQLPLPDGKLDIYIGYVESETLEVNHEFTIHNKKFKIADISYVDVSGNSGIIRIHAERREGKVE